MLSVVAAKKKQRRLHLQTTQKFGCRVTITIRHAVQFLSHRLPGTSLSATALKQAKKECLSKLSTDLRLGSDDVQQEDRFFVLLPKDDAHNGHTLTESSGLGHRLHPAVIRKINDLVALNITDTRHVTRLL